MSFKNFAPFIDPIDRVSDKPSHQEKGITDNGLLFTGEAALLLAELSELTYPQKEFMSSMLTQCRVVPGLYRRHPPVYQERFDIPWHGISHDEQNGITMMVAAAPELIGHLNNMIQYGKENGWQYNDLNPGSNFFKALLKSPISTIIKLKAYLKDYKDNPQDTASVDFRHDGDITAISSLRQPRDVAFYKIVANQKATLFSVLWLAIAMILCTRSTITDGSRGGTMLMAWFRNIALKRTGLKGYKGYILKLAISIFNSKLAKKYGQRYPEVLAIAYFDRLGKYKERHPMIFYIKKYLDIGSKKP